MSTPLNLSVAGAGDGGSAASAEAAEALLAAKREAEREREPVVVGVGVDTLDRVWLPEGKVVRVGAVVKDTVRGGEGLDWALLVKLPLVVPLRGATEKVVVTLAVEEAVILALPVLVSVTVVVTVDVGEEEEVAVVVPVTVTEVVGLPVLEDVDVLEAVAVEVPVARVVTVNACSTRGPRSPSEPGRVWARGT
jgi:hypothetical protein